MAAANDYPNRFAGVDAPNVGGEAVTPSDTVSLSRVSTRLYVGTAGDLSLLMMDGSSLLLSNVPVGFHDLRVERVNSTSTTATDLVALW